MFWGESELEESELFEIFEVLAEERMLSSLLFILLLKIFPEILWKRVGVKP